MMKNRIGVALLASILALTLVILPATGRAEEAASDGAGPVFVLGSILLSVVHLPAKLVTCAWTQTSSAFFYTATYGVPGGYEGGTNGRDIGETARRSCTGDWIIKPSQVKADYGE
jgi:hypothetical protein